MKKFLMCLAVVLFAGVMFTSCEKKSDSELLLGKWSVTSVTTTIDGVAVEKKIEGGEYMYYTFASEGKYITDVNADGEKWTEDGTYELNGKTLILDKGTVDENVFTIQELTKSSLVMKNKIGTLNMTKVN
ncbi:MAG: lipocalin family protein [Paludibacteraceae bacterium]|nr:lipocalin family protein [Paludibacteraceae bacterium]